MPSVQTLKQSDLSYKLIMMDYFLVLFIFVSTEDIILNEEAENMFIRNMVGIISSKRSQKWLKFFHRLTLGTAYISCLTEAKHQTCRCF